MSGPNTWLDRLMGTIIRWNGADQTKAQATNFAGGGVSVAYDATNDHNTVTITGGGTGGGLAFTGNTTGTWDGVASSVALTTSTVQATALKTTTTGSFTQPAIGSTVSVGALSTAFMYAGQLLRVVGGGYYYVSSVTNTTTVVLQNVGDESGVAAGATVSTSARIDIANGHTITGIQQIDTQETIGSSPSFVDLATVGPTVTLVTGTVALISVASISNSSLGTSSAGTVSMGVVVSGATTLAANSDSRGTFITLYTAAASRWLSMAREFKVSLTAGTNTFKLQYAVDNGSGVTKFGNRSLTVRAL